MGPHSSPGCLARFSATDGSGVWEVFPWGLQVNGVCYQFTSTSHIVHSGTQGRSYRSTKLVEEQDDLGLWAALAVYQETGSWEEAGLTAWALGGSRLTPVIETHRIPGNVTLSIGGLRQGDNPDASLRYREDGQWVQADALQQFADVCLAAIRAYRETHAPATRDNTGSSSTTAPTGDAGAATTNAPDVRPRRRRIRRRS